MRSIAISVASSAASLMSLAADLIISLVVRFVINFIVIVVKKCAAATENCRKYLCVFWTVMSAGVSNQCPLILTFQVCPPHFSSFNRCPSFVLFVGSVLHFRTSFSLLIRSQQLSVVDFVKFLRNFVSKHFESNR
jgi:hypothetical protein